MNREAPIEVVNLTGEDDTDEAPTAEDLLAIQQQLDQISRQLGGRQHEGEAGRLIADDKANTGSLRRSPRSNKGKERAK